MGALPASCQSVPSCAWKTEAPVEFLDLEQMPALSSSMRHDCQMQFQRLRSSGWLADHEQRMRDLLVDLFRLHDLDGNGVLQEDELISLNEQIAVLHHGDGADLEHVREKYRELFRSALAPEGEPVSCEAFCKYTRSVLDDLDSDPAAQEMILEQWSVEAQTCRELFPPRLGTEGHDTPCLKSLLSESDHDLSSTVDEGYSYEGTDSDADSLQASPAGGAGSDGDLPQAFSARGDAGVEDAGSTKELLAARNLSRGSCGAFGSWEALSELREPTTDFTTLPL